MGLNISHGAFSGAYSAFNRFRQEVARVCGGSYPPHSIKTPGGLMPNPELDQNCWYWGDGMNPENRPGLYVFFEHSDCDGEIDSEDCEHLADELEVLLSSITEGGGGHIAAAGGFRAVAEGFIAGCREAAAAGESLIFY